MNSLIKSVAWELGQRYDERLRVRLGDKWLTDLGYLRGSQLSVHDPSFVFGEPEHHSNSPVWEALPPRTLELVGQFRRGRITRNKWEHDTIAQNVHTYLQGVRNYRELSASLGLPTEATCGHLEIRVDEMKKGVVVAQPADVSAELRKVADGALKEAGEAKSRQVALLADAEASELARVAAEVEVRRAQDLVSALEQQLQVAQQEARLATDEPAGAFQPGDAWDLPQVGTRQLVLKRDMVDLFDPEQAVLLSDELGAVATQAARRWLAMMPRGGPVFLTPAGHAAGRVKGRWMYLGRLDLISEAFVPGAISALAPCVGGFELTDSSDVRNLDSDELLSTFIGPEEASRVAHALADSIQVEDIFRLTANRVVVVEIDGQWVQVARVSPEQWFGVAHE